MTVKNYLRLDTRSFLILFLAAQNQE